MVEHFSRSDVSKKEAGSIPAFPTVGIISLIWLLMKEKKVWSLKNCKKCKKLFQPRTNNQTMCQNPCKHPKPKSIAEINAQWISRTEEDIKNRYKNCKEVYQRTNRGMI